LKTKQIYDPKSIEPRWQKYWAENKVYQPDLQAAKKPLDKTLGKPFYNLMMFPYPSAEGLHVGNMYAFTGADVYGRFQRMQGYDVFEPIGLDGFGIHSENYAIKVGRHPAEHAKVSEKHFYEQLHMIGNGFAWDQKLETYDPDYYRWTQWLFVQMYKHGLAYRKKAMVNWCPSCKTVLSDEQVEGGICERCKTATTRKETEQWFFRITKYANRLLENLEKIDWPGKIKIAQRNWIGKKEGALVEFKIQSSKFETKVEAFTTRIDTIFGVTFLVVAPEIAKEWISRGWKASARVSKYVQESLDKPNEERKKGEKEKTGIDTGLKAVNLASREKMPVLVADYVLKDVGTGVVMGVPAHDQRDFEFAIKMNLIVKPVIRPKFVQNKLDKDCLENLLEIIRMAKKDNKRLIVGGGWIVDAYLGLRIRNHTDIDMYVPYREVDYWQKYFLGRHFVVNNHKGLNKDERYYKSFSFQVPKEQKYLWVDVVGIGIERGQMFDMEEGKKEFWGMSEEEAIFEGEIQGEKVECLSPKFKIKSILECKRAMKVTEPEKDYAKYDLDLEMLGNKALTREGILFNSGKYNGIDTRLAKGQMIENGLGKRFVSYHLRDWLISRQRYWGPPIPMIFCKNCADKKSSGQSTINNQQPTMSGWFPVTEEQLPVLLPYVKDFQPLGEGKTPLQKAPKEWLKVKCPNCGKMAERSTEVSDTFLDSSWYFLAYPNIDYIHSGRGQDNREVSALNPFNLELTKKWLPVDAYIGGAEHAVLHLLYSRFVWMALSDWDYIPKELGDEPFPFLFSHGLIIKDGAKMSKSRGNVVTPDAYIARYGADALRMYLMFLGPYSQGGDFRDSGMAGMYRFLERLWRMFQKEIKNQKSKIKNHTSRQLSVSLNKTIKKVTEDIAKFKYNTAIAALMEFMNSWEGKNREQRIENREQRKPERLLSKEDAAALIKLFSPFIPHLAEELWARLGNQPSVHVAKWPSFDDKLAAAETARIPVQVNGKTRAIIEIETEKSENQNLLERIARKNPSVVRHLTGKKEKQLIFVSGKILNFVVE